MNKMRVVLVFLSCLAAASARADSTASEKPGEKPAEKPARRLKGEFKGHPIAPAAPEAESVSEAPKPAPKKPAGEKTGEKSATKRPEPAAEKPIVIDNARIGETPKRGGGKAEPPAAAPAPPPSAVTIAAPVDLNGHGEDYWRAKAKGAREALASAQDKLEAARLEEKREENDFYAWDDGQYRDSVIKPAWDRSREETARAEEALAAAQKAVDDLDDEARKAGAYPGWIRE